MLPIRYRKQTHSVILYGSGKRSLAFCISKGSTSSLYASRRLQADGKNAPDPQRKGGQKGIACFNNTRYRVSLIVDDCLIRITRKIPSGESDSAELFTSFMNDEANVAVAPFFSTDETEYKTALAKLVTGIRTLSQSTETQVEK